MAAARANLLEVLTPDAYAHLDALTTDRLRLPGRDRQVRPARVRARGRLEGLRHFLDRSEIADYESFKANQDAELCDLAWL